MDFPFVSPINQSKLVKRPNGLVDEEGNTFPITNGLFDFTYPKVLPDSDQQSLNWYKNNSATYDEYLPLTFQTFGVNEDEERNKLISALNINPTDTILETGCGTGRDSIKIIEKLGKEGRLFLQDLSPDIIDIAKDKIQKLNVKTKVNLSIANACYLPFKDNFFDKVFHFGGLNTFGDIKRSFKEIARVVKPGGRVVVGDESMPPWLRDTEFGKVLMNSNHHYKYEIPLKDLPVEARNVRIDWVIGGVFFVIAFDLEKGEPPANLDFPIPGPRGGTHRTRFYGHLEGVSPNAMKLAKIAREKSDLSMHDWLNEAIIKHAKRALDEEA